VFAVRGLTPDAGLPPCPADTYFLENPHFTLTSSSSTASFPQRGRSEKEDDDGDDDDYSHRRPPAKRQRIVPSEEGVTRAMRDTGIDDSDDTEQAMIDRAIRESLLTSKEEGWREGRQFSHEDGPEGPEVKGKGKQVERDADEDEDFQKALALSMNDHDPSKETEGADDNDHEREAVEANGTSDAEDETPTVEELRRRRLARFG
jgi:Ubiquitin interaction motif